MILGISESMAVEYAVTLSLSSALISTNKVPSVASNFMFLLSEMFGEVIY
jgi:hypothetical protein